MAELALDLDIPPRFQLGILGIAGVDLPLGIELAEVLTLFVAAANDAVAYRDAAPASIRPPSIKPPMTMSPLTRTFMPGLTSPLTINPPSNAM